MSESVELKIGRLAFDALAEQSHGGVEHVPVALVEAIRCYLSDKGTGRPGWTYPRHLVNGGGQGKAELHISIDESLWASLIEEAERQAASVSEIAGHAALYYAAEADAGRLTDRIVNQIGNETSVRSPDARQPARRPARPG